MRELAATMHPVRLRLLPVCCPMTVSVGSVIPLVTVMPVVIILLELITLVTLKLVALKLAAVNWFVMLELTIRELVAMMHPERLILLPVCCPTTVSVGSVIPLVTVRPVVAMLLVLIKFVTVRFVVLTVIIFPTVAVTNGVMTHPDRLTRFPVMVPITVRDGKDNPFVIVKPVVVILFAVIKFVLVI